MMLLQFQFTKTDIDELQEIPNFCKWLCDQLYSKIDTNNNRVKIKSRINYLKSVKWIQWTSSKTIDLNNLFDNIYDSIRYTQHKNNLWLIYIDNNIKIPNTRTSLLRLLRFLNYGDVNMSGMNILSTLENKYNSKELNSLWKMFILETLRVYNKF